MAFKMKNYKCVDCGRVKRAWIESDCYKQTLCPKCLNRKEKK
jgi:DNA-directed RNA polymerase subunit RPC12/RpoP